MVKIKLFIKKMFLLFFAKKYIKNVYKTNFEKKALIIYITLGKREI